jgi:membrane-bound lytic murein transglycosylase D
MDMSQTFNEETEMGDLKSLRSRKSRTAITSIVGIACLFIGLTFTKIFQLFAVNPYVKEAFESSIGVQQSSGNNHEQPVSRLSLYRTPDSLDFCGEPVPLEIPDVKERMEQAFYTELSDAQIILDLKRSTMYFPFIEQKLRDSNMPLDLKYLPVAESALRRNIVSSRNAAGIWQFTNETARRYGLIVNQYIDERFNFRKATEAALKFLGDLHLRFGSWTLAVAAYNMGSSGLKANLDYQMVNNYYSLYLNDETYRFVFRIVALKEIISHYKKYGFELSSEDLYQPPDTKLIVVSKISDLATWARQQGSSYKEIKTLNPWIINHSLPPGTWAIEVPKYAQRVMFTTSSPIIDSTFQNMEDESGETSGIVYVVKPGDTLEKIAAYYGVSVRDIVSWNNLTSKNHLIVGKKLRILVGEPTFEQ